MVSKFLRFALFACLASRLAADGGPLKKVADIPLPGSPTRFDYQSLAPASGRLYLSHMGNGRLVVFDTIQNRVLADLPGYPETTGVLCVPDLGRVYSSAPGEHEIVVTDTKSLAILARVFAGRFPDGLAYAPKQKRVFVSDEAGRQEIVVDGRGNRVVKLIPMGGEVGNSRYDAASGRVFACVQTSGELVEIDPSNCRILARHPLEGGRGPHGLLLDEADGLAFVACEDDARLLVVSLKSFRVLRVLSTGREPDVLALDPGLGRLYVGCEGDVISVFALRGKKLEKLEDEPAGRDCHSVCVDPATHRVYVPLENVDGRPVLRVFLPR